MLEVTLRIGSLCSGYGGLELAVAAALSPLGVSTAWHAETDDDASAVLKWRFPDVPNLGDVKTLAAPPVDLLAMGVPCQPVSAAGEQLVYDDPRWLWPYALRVLADLRPPAFVFENVRNLISIREGTVWAAVLADMRAAGYAVRWLTIGACAVGAPHHRHRVFAIGAYVGSGAPPVVRLDVDECGARRGLLATPVARDGGDRGGEGDAAYWFARGRDLNRAPLGAQVTLLPSPPARDGQDGRGQPAPATAQARLDSGRRNLDDAIAVDFGPYAPAVARWEALRGVAAPEPTELGPKGGRRLAGAFPEWMMGLDPGWITGVPGTDRKAALKMAGNGVCPQQGAEALRLLLQTA